ncbi:MAG: isoprenyl transferase [Alphaproteobacteria bacterium]|nr:isoprenyl transferase [Alphaproteobacteria bacterium]
MDPGLRRDDNTVPTHIAIIMDGNGRWAKARGLPRTAGHKKGAESLRRAMNACRKHGVKHLTVYAFSSENWNRPADEINDLMQLLQHYLRNELQTLHENQIRLRFIGDLSQLDEHLREQVDETVNQTTRHSQFNLTIALSYGGRQEITRAVQKLAKDIQAGRLKPEQVTEQIIAGALDTAELPEPDLLIRTGGEQRISNFLLWQSAYTEFYFCDTLWPDFGESELEAALQDFSKRERRFGTAGES